MLIRLLIFFLAVLFTSCDEAEDDSGSVFDVDPSEQIPETTSLNKVHLSKLFG